MILAIHTKSKRPISKNIKNTYKLMKEISANDFSRHSTKECVVKNIWKGTAL